ncbi:MAG: hypothetical protein ABI556_05060 [Gemmatimonadales bacterium]
MTGVTTLPSSEVQNTPTKASRLAVAVVAGSAAVLLAVFQHLRDPNRHFDFGLAWFAGRQLLSGVNPYPLVGPGLQFDWPWFLLYPATAGVAVLPLSVLPELAATLLFVGMSASLLTYGLTRNGWDRLWILPSSAFVIAVMAAQWSPLFCAVLLMPRLGWVLAAKPSLGLAIVAGARSGVAVRYAFLGGVVLLALSFALVPTWFASWLTVLQLHSAEVTPALIWPGGPFILLALLRWRRAETWLITAMAVIPLTPAWYETLPLLLIPRSKRECQVLSLLVSVGYLLQAAFLLPDGTVPIGTTRALVVAFGYLPAVIVVLRRGNERDVSVW